MRLADKVATMARRGAPLPYLRRLAYLYSPGNQHIEIVRNIVFPAEIGLHYGRENWGYNYNVVFGDAINNCFWFGARDGRFFRDRFAVEDQRKYFVSDELELPFEISAEIKADGNLNLNGQIVSSGGWYRSNRLDYGEQTITLGVNGARIYEAWYKCEDWSINLIPVLDLSGRPCFYDEVSGQFSYNQGTGEFTWGELDASSAFSASRGGVLNA